MKLFEQLGVSYQPHITEHEEAGRFLPIRNIKARADVGGTIADVSALLHLDRDVEAFAAVQYCMSELLRNVLEHSGSPEGGSYELTTTLRKDPTGSQSQLPIVAAAFLTTWGASIPRSERMI